MDQLNYAESYQQALEQGWPYTLYFGALFSTPNNGRYRWVNARTIEAFSPAPIAENPWPW